MYKSTLFFERTPRERSDPFLSWGRDDQAFFAAGACHILSDLFRQVHHGEEYDIVHLKPIDYFVGDHVYATDGTWAFDHDGWTREEELLSVTRAAYGERYPGWDCRSAVVEGDLETFCRENDHRLPWEFAHLPWERAHDYLRRFDTKPPA